MPDVTLPSLHDHLLISYEVNCERRQIELRSRRQCPQCEAEEIAVLFEGVEAYQLENDAFGNIIFSLQAVPLELLLREQCRKIAESYRTAGAPGRWAADLSSAGQALARNGIKGYVLSSSYGLSGWVLAKRVSRR
jgi:hypothetical protein